MASVASFTNCFGRAQNPTGYSVWVWHIVPPFWRVQLDQEITVPLILHSRWPLLRLVRRRPLLLSVAR